jgi:hypothetical protein
LAHFGEGRRALLALAELALELGIAKRGCPARRELERDFGDDVPVRFQRFEEAVAIREAALDGAEAAARELHAVEHADPRDRLAHVLAVRTHVLNRRGADAPRDAAQALQALIAARNHIGHESVPGFASGGPHLDSAASFFDPNAAERDFDHEPGKASVGHDDVAAATEHSHLEPARAGPG